MMRKFATIFVYSTTVTLVWWLLLHANALWAWLFFLPATALGLALAYLLNRGNVGSAMNQVLGRFVRRYNNRLRRLRS
jgi:hypothetical protein